MANIYKLSQTHNTGWDTYDSAIVTADNEDGAKRIHPYANNIDDPSTWGDKYSDWCVPEHVNAQLVGTTELPAGQVLCSSFNAG